MVGFWIYFLGLFLCFGKYCVFFYLYKVFKYEKRFCFIFLIIGFKLNKIELMVCDKIYCIGKFIL